MRPVLLVGLVALGCTEPPGITLAITPNPIAVGATLDGLVETTRCDGCDRFPVQVESLVIEPAGVFEIVGLPAAAFALRAIAAGTATLTFEATSQGATESFTRVLVALDANGVRLQPPPCGGPLVFTIAAPAYAFYEILHDATPLRSRDYYPFDATGISIDTEASQEGALAVRMPAAPGTGQLTSLLDPSATLTFDAIAPTAIDRIEFGTASAADVFDVVSVGIDVFFGPTRICGDTITRTFTSLTADICTFRAGSGSSTSVSFAGPNQVDVRGLSAGTCMISAALAGTSLVATTAITFTM